MFNLREIRRNKRKLLFKFLWISAYLRRCCFCSHRLFVFKRMRQKCFFLFVPSSFLFLLVRLQMLRFLLNQIRSADFSLAQSPLRLSLQLFSINRECQYFLFLLILFVAINRGNESLLFFNSKIFF